MSARKSCVFKGFIEVHNLALLGNNTRAALLLMVNGLQVNFVQSHLPERDLRLRQNYLLFPRLPSQIELRLYVLAC